MTKAKLLKLLEPFEEDAIIAIEVKMDDDYVWLEPSRLDNFCDRNKFGLLNCADIIGGEMNAIEELQKVITLE